MGQLKSPGRDKGYSKDGQGISGFLPFSCCELKSGCGGKCCAISSAPELSN